jgi:hypothetical protein
MSPPKKWIVPTIAALACCSCGGNGLYPVAGKVTYKGEPAEGAVVILQRKNVDLQNEHAVMGIVQKDGSFTLVCGHQGTGVPPGEYAVLIEWRQHSNQPKGLAQKGADRLKGRYADPKRPVWIVNVKPELNCLPAFDLTDEAPAKKK